MFGLTNFRVLGGHISHRAMVLADLDARSGFRHRGGVTVAVKRLRQLLRRVFDGLPGPVGRHDSVDDIFNPFSREPVHRFRSPDLT